MDRVINTVNQHGLIGPLLLICALGAATASNCGGFISIGSSDTGHITTPNYPGAYPVFTRCIWLFEAPPMHRVMLSLTFEGQETNTSAGYLCNDYIEIRDGSKTSAELLVSCSSLASRDVTSTARWLRLLFSSDGSFNNAGLNATYSLVYAGSVINNISSPVESCRTHEFSCSNKECLSLSYRCDGYFDCGCSDGGCDEDKCGGLTMPYWARMVMGIGIGIGLFVLVCMASLLWERRHNWARLRANDSEKPKEKR